MELNKDEFEHITDKLAGAMTRSLQDRIAQLEAEKAELQDLYEQSQKALTVQALALQAAQARIGQLEDEVSHLRSEQGQQNRRKGQVLDSRRTLSLLKRMLAHRPLGEGVHITIE